MKFFCPKCKKRKKECKKLGDVCNDCKNINEVAKIFGWLKK